MSSQSTQPQGAGWYPDPAGGTGLRWHDGQGWTGRTSYTTPRKPLGASFAHQADWLARALWLCCLVGAVSLVVELWGYTSPVMLAESREVGAGTLSTFVAVSSLVSIAEFLALLVAGVMWLVWQHRAASAAGAALRRSPGWHVGSWFIPLASLWMVPQNLADLWRIYGAPRRQSERPAGPPTLVYGWWLCWCVSSAIAFSATMAELTAGTTADLQQAALLGCLSALLNAIAVGTAATLVRQLSWLALLAHTDSS